MSGNFPAIANLEDPILPNILFTKALSGSIDEAFDKYLEKEKQLM
jgi:hypothetical protein